MSTVCLFVNSPLTFLILDNKDYQSVFHFHLVKRSSGQHLTDTHADARQSQLTELKVIRKRRSSSNAVVCCLCLCEHVWVNLRTSGRATSTNFASLFAVLPRHTVLINERVSLRVALLLLARVREWVTTAKTKRALQPEDTKLGALHEHLDPNNMCFHYYYLKRLRFTSHTHKQMLALLPVRGKPSLDLLLVDTAGWTTAGPQTRFFFFFKSLFVFRI